MSLFCLSPKTGGAQLSLCCYTVVRRITLAAPFLPTPPTVTLRISTKRDGGREVVMVDGRLGGDVVAELERVVAELSRPVSLDLAGLRSADEAGREALQALLARGVVVTGASPYFRLLLGLEGPDNGREPPSRPGSRKRNGVRGQGRN